MLYGEKSSKVIALLLIISFMSTFAPVNVYAEAPEPEVTAFASEWVKNGLILSMGKGPKMTLV